MAAGKRRKRVTIEQPTEAADASGQLVQSWSTYCQRWGQVDAVGGDETYERRQLQAETQWLITLPNDSETRGIRPTMRIVCEGRTINIARVYDPDGRRVRIEIQGTNPE